MSLNKILSRKIGGTPQNLKSIGIIGAGVSGIVTAKELSLRGYHVTVMDRNCGPGGVWHHNYDGAGLQFHRDHYNFPDHNFPDNMTGLPRLKAVKAHIESYMDKFHIHDLVQYKISVKTLRHNNNGSVTVITEDNHEHTFDYVVISTGTFSTPKNPSWEGQEEFQGDVIHSSQFVNARKMVKGKKVVVVGAGKSSGEIIDQVAAYGGIPTQLFRKPYWLFTEVKHSGIKTSQLMMSRAGVPFNIPNYNNKYQILIQKYLSAYFDRFWKKFEQKLSDRVPECIKPNKELRYDAYMHRQTLRMSYIKRLRAGLIKTIQDEVEKLEPNGIRTQKGKFIPADVIINCTGFSLKVLDFELEEDGLWLYRNWIHPDHPNIAFIGICNSTQNLLYSNMQAVWLARVLEGKVKLPDQQGMKDDIRKRQIYMRSVLPYSPDLAHSDQIFNYLDQLMADMGEKKIRSWKFFQVIKASDYADLVAKPGTDFFHPV